MDRDAVERAREHMTEYPPSSPSMGLFKDGKLVFMLQRTDLQQMNEEQVSTALREAFDAHCTKRGPSIAARRTGRSVLSRAAARRFPLMGVRS